LTNETKDFAEKSKYLVSCQLCQNHARKSKANGSRLKKNGIRLLRFSLPSHYLGIDLNVKFLLFFVKLLSFL
jgi:hypothetical protein